MKITEELRDDFLVYANEVNTNRAFPDVRDGLKPSQRGALWEMYHKGFTSNKPHVKCAKVAGGTIASWIPHGDQGVYEAMVRMSQPWINNIPEIDWHGANGSQLGGPQAASSRYTECRLAEALEQGALKNLGKDVVDFIPNFSEDETWPEVFPSLFPRLFVNGSQGIGYTIAQEWEPGNLKEFTEQVLKFIKTNSVNCKNIYPDYPSGGVIVNKKDIHNIYETGKGNIILRAKTEIDGNLIKITELPYQVYVEPVISKIKDLVNNNDITGIEDICNKSDDDGLLIEIECSEEPGIVLNKLFKLTDLQISFGANQMALINGQPKMFTLKDYIKTYVDFNLGCLRKEYKYDLDKAQERDEIVSGLIRALSFIDDVILTIKQSKTSVQAVANLVMTYEFTEVQAKAIVDMKLGKLANMEVDSLNKEHLELKATIDFCEGRLSDENLLKDDFLKRLKDFTKKYGWDRRTSVTDVDLTEERKTIKKTKKSAETYVIALTDDNFLKKIKLVDYRESAKSNIVMSVRATSKDKVVLVSEQGILYRIPVKKIGISTLKSAGMALKDLYPDKIIGLFSKGDEQDILLISKLGKIKRMSGETFYKINKLTGTVIFKLDEGDRLFGVYSVDSNDSFRVSTNRREHKIKVNDFTPRGKSSGGIKGVKGKNLEIIKITKE